MNPITLTDDTRLNVATLLSEDVGAFRDVTFAIGRLVLDGDLVANEVSGKARLTRLQGSVLAHGKVTGHVDMECVRCLNPYAQAFSTEFAEAFRQTVDLHGAQIDHADLDEADEDGGWLCEIDDAHELDMSEMLRQGILLALPMRPICGPECPEPPAIQQPEDAAEDDPVSSPFAALQGLLDDE